MKFTTETRVCRECGHPSHEPGECQEMATNGNAIDGYDCGCTFSPVSEPPKDESSIAESWRVERTKRMNSSAVSEPVVDGEQKSTTLNLSDAAHGWLINECAKRSCNPSDVIEAMIQGRIETEKMMRGFTEAEWTEIQEHAAAERRDYHCGCGAACNEEEYEEHIKRGHDATTPSAPAQEAVMGAVSQILDAANEEPCAVCGEPGDTLPCVACSKMVCGAHRDDALMCFDHSAPEAQHEFAEPPSMRAAKALAAANYLTRTVQTKARECVGRFGGADECTKCGLSKADHAEPQPDLKAVAAIIDSELSAQPIRDSITDETR